VFAHDILHRRMLVRLLPQFGIKDLPEATMRSLNLAWHRLDAWPDAKAGLDRLVKNFLLAPVSNANILLMADLAPWGAFR
jgi:2-haloacid dehalogenase